MRLVVPVAAGTLVLAASALPAVAAEQGVSDALKPPGGSTLIVRFSGEGSQIYACAPAIGTKAQEAAKPDALAWTLKGPEATLRTPDGKITAKHYAGPTWEASDGSKVVGTVVATQEAPAPGAVSWLLLSAKATGTGRLAATRYVQRIDTTGGVAPKGACKPGEGERRVPYTADYLFYR